MKFLYVSTDSQEAKRLIDPAGIMGYQYHDMCTVKDGEEIAKRIEFNPMSSVTFDGNTPYKTVEAIALDLAENGLFTAIDSFASIKKIFPKDMESRNEILGLALQERYNLKGDSRKAYNLFLYSNNPHQIRKD